MALAHTKTRNIQSIDEAQLLQNLNIDAVQKSLDDMHKEVSVTLYLSRKQAIERHNSKIYVISYKLVVGDYVVVARTHGPRTKMSTIWMGPRRVSRILSECTVELEHLLSESKSITHVCRIKPYADSLVGSALLMREVADFTDRICWKGLTTAGDSWEPLQIMFEDVPSKIRSFFKHRRSNLILRRARTSLGL
eukprot:IDg21806t1